MDTQAEVAFLRDWAARHKAIFEDEGTCGFGRECVGITTGNAWIDLGPTVKRTSTYEAGGRTHTDTYDVQEIDPDAEPPDGVKDAYHKHDCLAVLGRGPDAIHQLYLWVKNLDDHGFTIGKSDRAPEHALDLLVHGTEYVFLTKPAV